MSNPILNRAVDLSSDNSRYAGFDSTYQNYSGGRDTVKEITVSDVLTKTLQLFAVLIPVALMSAVFIPVKYMDITFYVSIGLVLAFPLVFMFVKKIPVPLLFIYAAIEGVFVGIASFLYTSMFSGIVPAAILSTTIAAGVVFAGQRSGLLKTTKTTRKFFYYFLAAYLVFTIFALGAAAFGAPIMVLGSPLCWGVSIFGTAMAIFSLLIDIENIELAHGNPDVNNSSWMLAFGLMVSLVWLYLEMLRLIANSRR